MTLTLDLSLLENVSIFRGLDRAALGEVISLAHNRTLAPGESAFDQDEEATAFFVLLSGRVKVSQVTAEGHQVVLHFIGPGEMFGCAAVFGGFGYPGTATAVKESEAVLWTRPVMDKLMDRFPPIALNAIRILGSRMRETQTRLRELATERVERRIAHTLVRLAASAGRRAEGGLEIEFPLSRQDIAEMTGTTLHTVSRILNVWQEREIVVLGRQKVVIRDSEALATIADHPALETTSSH